MVKHNEMSPGLEWRIKVPDETSRVLEPEHYNRARQIFRRLQDLLTLHSECTAEYFKDDREGAKDDASSKQLQSFKCVLKSKPTEESMATFARWEPAHGNFNFRHPWKLYLKVGASARSCAYRIEALNSNISSKSQQQMPEFLKKHLGRFCKKLSTNSSSVLSELASMIRTITKSSRIDLLLKEMSSAVEDLQSALKSLPNQSISPPLVTVEAPCNNTVEPYTKPNIVRVVEIVPLITIASLLIDIAARLKEITASVNELATRAEFEPEREN